MALRDGRTAVPTRGDGNDDGPVDSVDMDVIERESAPRGDFGAAVLRGSGRGRDRPFPVLRSLIHAPAAIVVSQGQREYDANPQKSLFRSNPLKCGEAHTHTP